MRKILQHSLMVLGLLCGIASQRAFAVDHNNLDGGRPLSFDDAEAVAYRERSVETGISIQSPDQRPAGYGLAAEFLYGLALNTHVSVDLDPKWGGRAASKDTRFDLGNVSVGGLYNFNREYRSVPAFALRGDVAFPTGRDSQGVNTRLRAILSKTIFQYSRVHLNVDGTFIGDTENSQRTFDPGVVLGFSRPLGYPRHFPTTGLAEIGVRRGDKKRTDPVYLIGLGVRHQLTVRSVIDVGVQSEALSSSSTPHDDVRFVAGYSVGY